MDSNLLKVFVSVANNNSISLGAQELGYAQSNVTSRIKQLEKNIGYSLFHRIPKGVKLTHEGEKLYPFAIEIVKKVEEAILQMKNVNHQTILRIGSTQSNAPIRLLPFVTKLNNDFPQMKIELFTNTTPLVISELLDYKIDIGFVSGNPNHKDIMVLQKFEEDIYLIESKEKESENCILGYKESCAYYTFLASYFKNQGNITFKTTIFENYETILGCTKIGMGKSVVPKSIIDKFDYSNDLKMTKLNKKEYDLSTHLVCRKDYIPMISEYLKTIKL
ncbi:MAG: LysR family transcriptional regulator [Poseidonibacter sp.]|uniref:LysR family transcriptional regulator n=1 Tax=Poseidonibacter sp. TaxID=2321188 RepID=UPI00359D5CED